MAIVSIRSEGEPDGGLTGYTPLARAIPLRLEHIVAIMVEHRRRRGRAELELAVGQRDCNLTEQVARVGSDIAIERQSRGAIVTEPDVAAAFSRGNPDRVIALLLHDSAVIGRRTGQGRRPALAVPRP